MKRYRLMKSIIYRELDKKSKDYQEEVSQLKKEFDILFMKSPICYVILRSDFRIVEYNQAFEKLFEILPNSLIPITDYVEFDYQEAIHSFFEKVSESKLDDEIQVKMTDGYVSYNIRVICRPIEKNNSWLYHCALLDITREMLAIEQVTYLNYHDQLTGLYNRRFFEEELKRLNTSRNMPISLIMGDVLALHKVNQSHGFDMGNRILFEIGKLLKEKVREDDIVARTGEDMFAILLTKTSDEEVHSLVNRLSICFDSVKVQNVTVKVIWSFVKKGCSDEDLNQFIHAAENAVEDKKRSYKNL